MRHRSNIIGEFECCGCGFKWRSKLQKAHDCPKCKHLWIKWLNYEELAKEAPKEGWTGFGQ